MAGIEIHILILTGMVALLAGFVKGAVGFAMPMIMISGSSLFLPLEVALATLILPTLLTNGMQAMRQGWSAARNTIRKYRMFLTIGLLFLIIGAQVVQLLPQRILFLVIGAPVTVFAILSLSGHRWHIAQAKRARAEAGVAVIAGFLGGMSGVWGPPTVAYLTAIDAPKQEQIRAQGVIYGLGAVALLAAHIQTGIISSATLPLSFMAMGPALVGLLAGFALQDRVDQKTFRKLTLLVLTIAGLNLIRRGLLG